MTKIIESIGDIISLYDVFILDQWGVMHDGRYGYDHAIISVEKLIREKILNNRNGHYSLHRQGTKSLRSAGRASKTEYPVDE